MIRLLPMCLFLLLALSCRWQPRQEIGVRVQLQATTARRPPASAADFDCYLVSVKGEGIDSSVTGELASCLKLGKVSEALSLETLRRGVSFTLPSGKPLTIQIFGIDTASGSCRGGLLDSVLGLTTTEAYVVGSSETEPLFADSEVNIRNTYVEESSHQEKISACGSSGGGEGGEGGEGGDGELTLTRFFMGQSSGSSNPEFNENLTGSLPPFDFQSNSMDEELSFTGLIGASALPLSIFTSDTAPFIFLRTDLLFLFPDTLDPANFSGIRLEISAAAGTVSMLGPTQCNPQADADMNGDGFIAAPWRQSSFDINTVSSSAHDDISTQTRLYSPIDEYLFMEGSPARKFFHVSVRSNSKASQSTQCSAVHFHSAKAFLVPVSRR